MKKLLLLLPFILLLSCGIQKRKYQSGYHVSWKKSKSQSEKKQQLAGDKKNHSELKSQAEPQPETSSDSPREQQVYASTTKDFAQTTKESTKNLIKADPCDELVFNDGTELKVKITVIDETEIRYKKCDMPDGPVYVARKSTVFMVRYANGNKEVFKNQQTSGGTSSGANDYRGPQKTHPLAVFALIFGILSFLPFIPIVFSILAITLGKSAIKTIEYKPQQYKGLNIAKTGRILGIITLILWSVIAILVIGFVLALLLLAI